MQEDLKPTKWYESYGTLHKNETYENVFLFNIHGILK